MTEQCDNGEALCSRSSAPHIGGVSIRTPRTGDYRGLLAFGALAALFAAAAFPTAASAAPPPRPVSPGAAQLGAVTEARCPTFSWSGVAGAHGYRIAVFRVSELPGVEPALVASATVDGDARSFTPALGQCLERGQRYAWTVAGISGNRRSSEVSESELQWAPALLFEVEDAPSIEDLERVIGKLQRQLEGQRSGDTGDTGAAVAPLLAETTAPAKALARHQDAAPSAARAARTRITPRRSEVAPEGFLPGSLAAPTTATRIASAASTPLIGDASLKVSQQIHLADASVIFRNGDIFLWDDISGNTALGRLALGSVSGDASNNTAFGRAALLNTTGGANSVLGSYNTAVGDEALLSNTTGHSNTATGAYALVDNTNGFRNTASGYAALRSNTNGDHNTASGYAALRSNISGNRNTASGSKALSSNTSASSNTASGYEALLFNTSGSNNTASGRGALDQNTTGFSNTATGVNALGANTIGAGNTATGVAALINSTGNGNTALGSYAGADSTTGGANVFINNRGVSDDSGTIRIGTLAYQTSTFVAGIHGVSVAGAGVMVNAAGQLGVTLSSRNVKRDITTLAPLTERLLALRPVSFRYRELAGDDADAPLEYGLVAEEVAEIFPELVIYDQHGKPQTVKYHLLSSLLLGELQDQRDELSDQRRLAARQQAELQRLAARLEVLESRPASDPERSRK